jgi:adenosyl cobinamide kinase/adenosyl cobinamide phosphate guanylyltransferase
MLTREDLKNYKHNQKWIEERTEYIEELKSNVTNITGILSDMPKGSRKVEDSIAEKIVTLLDSINELLEKMVEADNKQKNILKQLEEVDQPYRLILEKTYINGKSLVTVASEMGYDYKYMCKMNGIALKKFENTTKKV